MCVCGEEGGSGGFVFVSVCECVCLCTCATRPIRRAVFRSSVQSQTSTALFKSLFPKYFSGVLFVVVTEKMNKTVNMCACAYVRV